MQFLKTFVGIGLLATAGAATALPVTLKSAEGTWTGYTSGQNVRIYSTNGGASNNAISWGSKDDRSGYEFNDSGLLPDTFETGEEFVLGTMTHHNQEIPRDSAIDSAKLSVFANMDVSGQNIDDGPYQFDFIHDETLNNAESCDFSFMGICFCKSYDGPVDDKVILDEIISSSAFEVAGYLYSMEIIGFEGVQYFETPEHKSTSADILARLNVEPTTSVPEPAGLALLGLGLLGLAAATRRLKRS